MTRCAFVTGASGFLGSYVVRDLLYEGFDCVYALVRGRDAKDCELRLQSLWWERPELRDAVGERVKTVCGDATLERFGLADAEFQTLAAAVTHIVHAAAEVGVNQTAERFGEVNVDGTLNALLFADAAQKAGGLQRFVHVSTAYVAGTREGLVHEDELADEVPMTREHFRSWSDLTVRLFDAFEQLGFEPQVTPKFMEDADKCVACGRCVLGCRFDAKWTADKLLDSCPHIEIRTGCTVERVIVEGGEARGVVVREHGRARTELAADLVVLAAGGLNTPVILNASGIPTMPTLFVDPVICVAARWQGAQLDAQLPMPFVSQREGYILSPYFDWLSFFFNGKWRAPSRDIMSIMVKYADSERGSFDGRRLDKPVTAHDGETIARSVEEASRVLDYMGVPRDEMFLGTLNAGHPGGCLPLTSAEAETLHHAALPANLYVADASLLPRSMGNPPILTIMALAKRVARLAANGS